MKQVNSKVYDKNYYLNVCLGFEEYRNNKGKTVNKKWRDLLSLIEIKDGMKVLDLGCGRGDVSFYMAKKGADIIGVDYSKDAITLANRTLKKMPEEIKRNVLFQLMDAKQIDFPENYFDAVTCFDVFEHLYQDELNVIMGILSRIIKKNGVLLIHTETNKIYLDFTHRFYVYPISSFVLKINKIIFKKKYPGLPMDPRNEYHKIQHVNEPTIFYLRGLFGLHSFKGSIKQDVGILKPVLSWKDFIYNVIVCLYPFSSYFPFNIFFATDYVCVMRNKK